MTLAEAFAADGVVAVVGAGGKKSTLYALAADLERAILTATVRIPPFDGHVDRLAVTDHPIDTIQDNETWPLGLVPARDGDRDRYLGYDVATVDAMAAATDVPILVKADGARTRWLKAPADDEPQLPTAADVVVPVASMRAVGESLDETHVHRPDRVATLTSLDPGDRIRRDHVTSILTHPEGGLKGVPDGASVRPLLNMVDDDRLADLARDVAADVLQHRRVEAVVLGRMDLRTVVDVVE